MEEIVPSNGQVPAEKRPEDLSPFDPEYPVVLLSHSLQRRMDQAQRAAERVYNAAMKNAPIAAQLQQATKKGFRLVVDATDSTLEAIDSGKIKLTIEKGGKTFAQIKNGNKYGEKLPIKRETFARGIDPVQMANAMQMRAIQEQMQEISCQIESIDHSVHEVIQGQQNDRIALYYSGVALYLEACKVNDQEMRKSLIAQALRGLSESSFQLTLKIQDDIKFLSDKKYDNDKKHRADTIRERMQSIEQSFSFIHQASMLRAAIYCKEGELQAMSSVLSEYSHFIGGTIAPNAQLLAECDKNDSGTGRGTWKSRKNLELDVTELVKRLDAPRKTLYLSMAQEAEEENEAD